MTTSNNQVWFYREKKLQRQISPLRIHQMVSELLAWPVWLERTYSLNAVLVTGAGPWRLTIYTPGRPQTPTPSRTSVVLWLFGRRAEPSHNPKGTSFKTRLFPALHVPSLETLGHMPADVITVQAAEWDSLPLWLSSLCLVCFPSCPLLRVILQRFQAPAFSLGIGLPWVRKLQVGGAACSTALAPFGIWGEQWSLNPDLPSPIHSPPASLALSDSAAPSLNSCSRLQLLLLSAFERGKLSLVRCEGVSEERMACWLVAWGWVCAADRASVCVFV